MKIEEWEERVERALRAKGWTLCRPKDRPPGSPTFVAYKEHANGEVIFAVLRCRTGQRRPTGRQRAWTRAAKRCTGAIGAVLYPSDYDRLLQMLGEEGT